MAYNFTVSSEIVVRLTGQGDLQAQKEALRDINVNVTNNITVLKEQNAQARSSSVSMRALAMDLRMLSIGLSILKREWGGINPIVDASISGLYQFSAAMSVGVAATRLLQHSAGLLRPRIEGLTTLLKGGTEAWATGSLSMGGYAAVAIITTAAIIGISTAIFESRTGISQLRTEIRGLERDMESLNAEMRDLQITQADTSAESSKYRYVVAALKREIELTGDPTGELATQLKAAEGVQQDLGVTMAYNTWQMSEQREATLRNKDAIEDRKDAIRDTWREGMRLFGEAVTPTGAPGGAANYPGLPPGYPETQIGGEVRRRGIIGVEAGEVIMQREQVATMMQGAGGGPVSVSISLAGAQITNVGDLEGALRRGGEQAAAELRRLELQRRRGRSRY